MTAIRDARVPKPACCAQRTEPRARASTSGEMSGGVGGAMRACAGRGTAPVVNATRKASASIVVRYSTRRERPVSQTRGGRASETGYGGRAKSHGLREDAQSLLSLKIPFSFLVGGVE